MARTAPRRPPSALPVLVCFAVCSLLMAAAVAWVYHTGSTLRFGDAEAHLNIARRIVDSRTPGWGQVGTTWLPLPHLLMLPLVRIDRLWQTGLAGAIPSAVSMAAAVTFFFAATRRLLGSPAAWTASGVFLLNPNALYLGSIPMTEGVFFASLFALLYFTVLFQQKQSWFAVTGAGIAALAGTLTRYEAWFLLPFVAVYIFVNAGKNRWAAALAFSVISGCGPLLWFAHNWWYFNDALEFYRGPYSPMAIQGKAPYPGKDDWHLAFKYFVSAGALVCGVPVLAMGAIGLIAAVSKKAAWPVLLLLLPPVFYVWGIHSSGGSPIHIPTLPPFSYYNTRYALAFLPLAAFGCAGLTSLWRPLAPVLVLASLAPFLLHPTDPPVVWKESDVNSRARLEWTRRAAEFLRQNAAPGDSYITGFSDLTAIYRTLAIPLRHTLTGDIQPQFLAVSARPDLFLWEDWAVVFGGDSVQSLIDKARLKGPKYDLAARIFVKDAPVVEIYHRYENPVRETARRSE